MTPSSEFSHDISSTLSIFSNKTNTSHRPNPLSNIFLCHPTSSILFLRTQRSTPLIIPSSFITKAQPPATSFISPVSSSPSNSLLPVQTTNSSSSNKHYINNNLLFGDPITIKESPSSKIIFTNINYIELSSRATTLESLDDFTYLNTVDIACMSETNSRWKNYSCYKSFV